MAFDLMLTYLLCITLVLINGLADIMQHITNGSEYILYVVDM